MDSSRRTAVALLVGMILMLLPLVACAQSGAPNMPGGSNQVVVSRASVPAPSASTLPNISTVLAASLRWNVIALANARIGAWSFAPALAVYLSRPVAVRRGAVL